MEGDNGISQSTRSKSLKASVKRRVGRFSLRKLSAPDSPEKRFEAGAMKPKGSVIKSRSLGPSW